MERLSKTKLRDAMLAKCFGVKDLAESAGLQPMIISKHLKTDSPCRLPTLGKIAKALNVEPKQLLID